MKEAKERQGYEAKAVVAWVDNYEEDDGGYFHEPCNTCRHRFEPLEEGGLCKACAHLAR